MSKAVLVIDMPKNCLRCDFSRLYGKKHYCSMSDRFMFVEEDEESKFPDPKCPLRELPEKDDCSGSLSMEQMHSDGEKCAWSNGWNACIDAITGGET